MKFKPKKFNRLVSEKSTFEKALFKRGEEYRRYDPGQYIYNLLLEKRKSIDVFSDEYLELVYTTLIAWNMNGRGAKLNDFNLFKETIRKNKDKINSLKNYKIETLNEKVKIEVLKTSEELFHDLDLVGKSWTGNKIKSKLVTFSKTLHFLIPDLFVPIDRKYTLDFFYDDKIVPTHTNILKNNELQLKVFNELYNLFCQIAKVYNLKEYTDNRGNTNIPKVIDNSIIGYSKL